MYILVEWELVADTKLLNTKSGDSHQFGENWCLSTHFCISVMIIFLKKCGKKRNLISGHVSTLAFSNKCIIELRYTKIYKYYTILFSLLHVTCNWRRWNYFYFQHETSLLYVCQSGEMSHWMPVKIILNLTI